MLNHIQFFENQINGLKEIQKKISLSKKRNKCDKILKPINELILELKHQITDTTITTKQFQEAYNEIVYLFDHNYPQLKQIIFSENRYELVKDLESIENAFEEHKDKKEEDDKLLKTEEQTEEFSIIRSEQGNQTTTSTNIQQAILITVTSPTHPIVGRIYHIPQSIKSIFNQLFNTQLSSPSNILSSSSSISSTSTSSNKTKKSKSRHCLVIDIDQQKVTILPITSFDNKDPAKTKNDVVFPTLSRNDLLNRLIVIGETTAFPRKKRLKPRSTSNAECKLYGYLVLIKTLAADNIKWPEPIDEIFCSSDIHYINTRLREVEKEEQSMSTHDDLNETSETSSSTSVPTARSIIKEKHVPYKSITEDWLTTNMPNYHDNIMMIESSISKSSSPTNLSNKERLSYINSSSAVDYETKVFNNIWDEQLPSTDDDNHPICFLFNETGKDLIIDHLSDLKEFDGNLSSTSINLQSSGFIRLLDQCQLFFKIGYIVKSVNINQTCKRVYDLSSSTNSNQTIQMLSDIVITNDYRRVIFQSLVKIHNNTSVPLNIINIINSLDTKQCHKIATIEVNDQYYVPIDLLYSHPSSLIYITVDANENNIEMNNCCLIDWKNKSTMETTLKLKNETIAHLTIYKEPIEAYLENTDQLDCVCFNLYIHSTLRLTNLLPIDIKCLIDNIEQINLKSSQSSSMLSANKKSTLNFIIPSYDNKQWISDLIDLKNEGTNDHNEYLVLFHNVTCPNLGKPLRMILRVDAIHESYHLSLYSPFWIFNYTELKLEFQIENNRTFIDVVETPILICPEKFESAMDRKGQIRLYDTETTSWSNEFSLDVIRSIDAVSCEKENERTYMICVDVVTCSSGLTKIVEFSPSIIIINKSTVAIEVIETISDKDQDPWIPINPEQTIPFWPHNIKDGLMRVRYMLNRVTSSPFMFNPTYRIHLRMDCEQYPALCVEVTSDGLAHVRIIFEDATTDSK